MKKKLVYGLMALSLCPPAQARPDFPLDLPACATVAQAADVVQFIVRSLSAANEQEVIDLVKANPELARRSFDLALKEISNKKPEERDARYNGLFWTWARALGGEELKQRLLAAQIPDQPMAFTEVFTLARGFAQLLIAMGNYQQSERLFTAMEKNLAQAQGAEADQQRLYLAKARMVGGRYLLARQQGDALVELARSQKNPDELLELYTCLLDAGRMGGFPDVTNRYLEPLQQAVAALPPEKRAFWHFYSGSFAELRQLERNPETSVEEFCRRHDAVWEGFKQANPFESAILGRVFGHLSTLWLARMADFYQLRDIPEDSPEDKRLSQSLMIELDLLNGAISAASKNQNYIQSYAAGMAMLSLLNDAHEQALRVNQPKQAARLLPEMVTVENYLVKTEAEVREQEKQVDKLIRGCLANLPGDFSFNLLEGDWMRQRTRIRLAQLQQLLADSRGKLSAVQLSKAQKLAAEAVTLNQRALRGVGYQGSEDARWAVAEYQLRFRPPGWPKEADRLLSQLAQVNQQLGYREGISRVAMLRGRLLAAQGQNGPAIQSLQQAVDGVEAYLTEVEAGEAGSRAIRDRYKAAYQLLAKLQLSSGKATSAFQTVSRQLQAQAAQQNQDSLRNNTQLREVQRVRAETAALERQVADERLQGKDTQASEQLLASSKGEYQRVVADLRRSHPQYEGAMAVRPVEFLELKKSIPADTTAVLYFVSDDGVYSFVASQQGDLKIHKVAVDPKELEKSVLKVRQLINLFPHDPNLGPHPEAFRWNDPGSPGYQRQSLPLKTELARLDKWLIDPIEGDLGGRPVLAIVPTGVLHYVPFPALCSLDAAGNPKFLAENYQCVNLVKTSDLVPLAGSAPGKKLFAVGNPDGSLPGAEREVNSITASFPQARKVIGREATASLLKKLEPDTGYVHLATHGQLSEADPKNSYLVMAGSGESAHFRATDIYDLDWQGVRLVTLSACKTALQEGKPGAAITSLAEAFRVAGGHSVVASLWSVEDNATEQLMIEFYKQLAQGKSLAASLQSAETTLSKQAKFSHPFFWAAFTLFGDWR
ncbi:MAG: CHAT domain-containing protein [Candidatus Eremiobacteraeota bacterium]|nr:CHAT domain-containing protein [Candidatus Eremiobacteraeota bacterium]